MYVHSLATAPWNRPSIENPPRYRLVGSTLLEFAQFRSQEVGYGGLVGLHSLPGAENFYRQAGLMECGADPDKENLVYFEFYPQDLLPEDSWGDRVDWDMEGLNDSGGNNDF